MRPRGVVVGDPSADELASLIKIGEQALVEKLVAHSAVEGLDVAVLHRLAWRDVMPFHPILLCPAQDGIRSELGAVVRNDHAGLTACIDECRKLACNPFA